MMSVIPFTKDQQQAIEIADRSVVVTAAAGSGKTAVLAERCAHLVCDADPKQRCSVDELLVVTFTEAAAAEMKSRILAAIRSRQQENPIDRHLQTQAVLIDTAQISTLHAFCLWLLRRWFSEASIDPTAVILQAEEARLLREETIDRLFDGLYEDNGELGQGFVKLVDVYGLGRDQGLAQIVLKLADFLRSLPEPEKWLEDARQAVGDGIENVIDQANGILHKELTAQAMYVRSLAEIIQQDLPAGADYGIALEEYNQALDCWANSNNWDQTRQEIVNFKVSAGRGVRVTKSTPQEQEIQILQARELFKSVQKKLFEDRLLKTARLNSEEMADGLQKTAPYVLTLCQLASEFSDRYSVAKKKIDALDFSDLERGAFDLLRDPLQPYGLSTIAHELHARFRYVLVDEFQDINPLQAAILECASLDRIKSRAGNLFCVGDIKQSIYGFRLAEPEMFQRRIDRANGNGLSASLIRLQKNFRSQPDLIEAINLIFARTMSRELGGVDYDDNAKLHAGRESDSKLTGPPIQLHLLERKLDASTSPNADEHDDAQGLDQSADPTEPAEWKAIAREAYVIGNTIRQMRDESGSSGDDGLAWSDIAVLLRSTVHRAGTMAEMLRRMGIPARAAAGENLFEATEIRDVLALLQVLDNPQQDIPIASVLRSGVGGLALTEDDLLAIRNANRDLPFCRAVLHYRSYGSDPDLVERLDQLLSRLDRWRRNARQRPLADVLWAIYQESGYLAYVGGLAHGATRRANLLSLHQRARQFSQFFRQGLHRFLRFIESLEATNQNLQNDPPTCSAENAVSIMSIHRSKGLEFRVVFVADLGTRFNFTDSQGRIIFDRRAGLGAKVVDIERMIEYPSVLHNLINQAGKSSVYDEEMRLLYVALTRAKERLVLIASTDLEKTEADRAVWNRLGRHGLSISMPPAGTPLDWIIRGLASAADSKVDWMFSGSKESTLVQVMRHDAASMSDWDTQALFGKAQDPALQAVAALQPLPDHEPHAADAFDAAQLLDRLDLAYPHLSACSVRAALGASEAKRAIDPFADEHQTSGGLHQAPSFDAPAILTTDLASVTPALRGTLTHRVLQVWDFQQPAQEHLAQLLDQGVLSTEEATAIRVDSLDWLASTELANRIQRAGDAYRREVTFISLEPVPRFDPALEGICDDEVLVRGIVDGLIVGDDGLEIVEFKTDAIDDDQVTDRTEKYRMQVQLYARAMERAWRRPIRHCWLVFLEPRRIIEVSLEHDQA